MVGFFADESPTLGVNRSYKSEDDESVSPGGYYRRLMSAIAEYHFNLVAQGLNRFSVPDVLTLLHTDNDRFRGVMIADGTVLRLNEFPLRSKQVDQIRMRPKMFGQIRRAQFATEDLVSLPLPLCVPNQDNDGNLLHP